MPQQYPSRSSVHRPAPLPAPWAAADQGLGTRAERRLAERAAERRRRAQRRRTVQTGSLAAVTSAVLLAGVTVDRAASAPEPEADGRLTTMGPVQTLPERARAAARSSERGDAELLTLAVEADVAHTRDLADEALARAAELVATEARATPALRDEVLAASAIVVELMRRVDAAEGLNVATTDDAELASAADAEILAAAQALGVEPGDDGPGPEVVSHALAHMVAELGSVLADATPATVAVEPAALTPADVLAQQVAEGVADAERLASMADATSGFENGRLPLDVLAPLSWAPGHHLRPDAAAQLERLNIAFRAQFGHDLQITDSYRSFAGQVAARRNRGRLAAVPGTSNHGWGVAVDLGSGINRFGTATHRWMRENAPKFGWDLPGWARENGAKPEPWHWEFEGAPESVAD